jgi:hypothetical protein
MDVVGNTTKNRAEGEGANRPRKYPARAEAVGHPSTDGDKNRQAQGVAGQHGFHAERGNSQRPGDRGNSGIQDRGIQRLHEKSHGDEPGQKSLHGFTWHHGMMHDVQDKCISFSAEWGNDVATS